MYLFSAFFYYLFIFPLSLLPFRILYIFSDFLFIIIYRISGYRRKVVMDNLKNSFPEKSVEEYNRITKAFYHHFCDLLMESFKMFSISEKEIRERIIFENPEEINQYFDKGKNIIMAGGHYNNWEVFAVACQLYMKHKAIALYKPLANKWFDKKMRSTRGRFGLTMVSIHKTKAIFSESSRKWTATIFAMDQSPSKPKKSHWMKFLNQDTAVSYGVEKYAREYNYPVVFGRMHKKKRGFYSVIFETIATNPVDEPKGKIVEQLTRLLEKDILDAPEYWLWSHRRWKHKKPASA